MKKGSNNSVSVLLRNIPRPLLEKFDEAWKDEAACRSEILRALMRDYIRRKKGEVP